jgi:Phytanoyl-CoA dioxygenase (PhyH)
MALFAYSEATKSRSREALGADGVVAIRGFLAADRAADLRITVNDIYYAMASDGEIGDGELAERFQAWNGVWFGALPAYLAARRPELGARISGLLDDVINMTRRRFGYNWYFLPERSYLRRHVGMTKQVPWHVDADAASVAELGSAIESINVWMPLDHVGTSLPSLEVVAGSADVMRKIPHLTGDYRYRDDDFVAGIGGVASSPILDPGDALIFDQYTLHRTQRVSGQDIVRTACEFRFVKRRPWRVAARELATRLSSALARS